MIVIEFKAQSSKLKVKDRIQRADAGGQGVKQAVGYVEATARQGSGFK